MPAAGAADRVAPLEFHGILTSTLQVGIFIVQKEVFWGLGVQDGPIEAADAMAIRKLDAAVKAMLCEDLPEQLARARQAMAQGNVEAAIAEVHSIRGSAGFCKLGHLHQAAASAETKLREQDLPERDLLDPLAAAVGTVIEILNSGDAKSE